MTTIDERFALFHQEHPEVYKEIIKLARQAKSSGRKRVGMKALFEIIRWERYLRAGDDGFKLNNVFTSRYTRMLAQDHPRLAELFETRTLRAA